MGNSIANKSDARRVYAILARVFGSCFLVFAICTAVSIYRVNDMLANSTHVSGQVVGLMTTAKGAKAPVVRFQTATGEMIQARANIASSSGPAVGDTVKVLYRTADPHDWLIDDFLNVYFWTMMSSIFSTVWGIVFVIMKVLASKSSD